jgi:hypothetical protein
VLHVIATTDIDASADTVWALAGAFDRLDRWVPHVSGLLCAGQGVGAVRRFTVGGHTMEERQVARDESNRSYSYRLLEGPLPVADYEATITVEPLDAFGARVSLSARCEPVGIDTARCEGMLREAYRHCLLNLSDLAERAEAAFRDAHR